MKKKKFLSLLLVLVMCLTLIPAAAVPIAAAEGHTHCVCGKTDCSGEGHSAATTWQAWKSVNSLPTTEGNYYLTESVTLTSTWDVGANIALCLNGQTITCTGNAAVITVSSSGNLTITDCHSGDAVGKITHSDGAKGRGITNKGTLVLWNGAITGNKSYINRNNVDGAGVHNEGTFTMYGGSISGNEADNAGLAGGVCNYGTFTMSGGKIAQNNANQRCGGVRNGSDATFTMSGTAEISGNTAVDGSGGVENAGTFTMSGGKISNNETSYGGGVENSGTFIMSGGTISGNRAIAIVTEGNLIYGGCGGGVRNSGTFTMSGGTISGNSAVAATRTSGEILSGEGGGVYNDISHGGDFPSTKFIMSGGAISDNTAATGGGVYIQSGGWLMHEESSTFEISGTAEITGNSAINGGGGVYVRAREVEQSDNSSTLTLKGNVNITENTSGSEADQKSDNLYLTSGATASATELTEGAKIGLSNNGTQGKIVSNDASVKYFVSEVGSAYKKVVGADGTIKLVEEAAHTQHCICGGETAVGDHAAHTDITWTEWNGTDAISYDANNTAYVYLNANVTLSDTFTVTDGKTLNLCLNGKTITGADGKDAIAVSNGASLIITDCHSGGDVGKITHESGNKGVGVYVMGGTLNMYGGQITGNTTEDDIGGAGVKVRGVSDKDKESVFNLYGGSITGNNAKSGGGVHVSRIVWYGDSQFNMYGGSISGNTATVASDTSNSYGVGGGVYVSWTAEFKMTGGSITSNIAKFAGAGVYLSAFAGSSESDESGAAKFEVSGAPKITGNKVGEQENNVYLDAGTSNDNYKTVNSSITILDGLSDKAKIGVTTETEPTEENRVLVATNADSGTDYSNIFTSDNDTYEIQKINGTKLKLAVKGDDSEEIEEPTHSWVYTMKGESTDTIIVTCSVGDCTTHSSGSITITAPTNLTDDGTAKTANLTSSLDSSITAPTITYTKSGDEGFSGTPTEAGTYTASITLGTGDDEVTASVTYTIAKRSSGKNHSNTGTGTVTDNDSNSTTNDETSVSGNTGYATCGKGESCPVNVFADAANAEWYHDGIHYCLDNGLMVGTSETTFSPNDKITRAQIVTMLWRKEGSKVVNYAMRFKDVASDSWYAEAIRWAASEGVVTGYSDEVFDPDDSITREQLASILYRYAKYKGMDVSVGEDTNIMDFDDVSQIGSYAVSAIQWACGSGIMNGTDKFKISPQGSATRAQAACMMQRFLTGNK